MVGTEAVLKPDQIALSEAVFLVKHADLRVRFRRDDTLAEDCGLRLVVRLPAHGPWEMLGIGEHTGARRDEELRDLVVVHVLPHRRTTCRAEAIEQKGDLLLLHETARLLDRLG